MIKLFTNKELKEASYKDTLPFKCPICNSTFYRRKKEIVYYMKNKDFRYSIRYCSQKCSNKNKKTRKTVKCKRCDKKFEKELNEIKSTKNNFCSRSCAATYNNLHKTTGTRRSKLEKWLEEQLTVLYPDLEIHFNKKDAINSELDIFIPSLKLAFELNGIYHYEPIHGQKKLDQIKNNDHRKYAACIERDIELCLIDTSMQKYVKPKTSQKFLDIVTSILDSKI